MRGTIRAIAGWKDESGKWIISQFLGMEKSFLTNTSRGSRYGTSLFCEIDGMN
jgi:hypothetical protein